MMTCACTPCPECKGTGFVWVSVTGDYLGDSRRDDMDIDEPCELCGGGGTEVMCEQCYRELWELLK